VHIEVHNDCSFLVHLSQPATSGSEKGEGGGGEKRRGFIECEIWKREKDGRERGEGEVCGCVWGGVERERERGKKRERESVRVCEREREKERKREKEKEREREREREKGNERERESVYVRVCACV